jgi:hypothetical protein
MTVLSAMTGGLDPYRNDWQRLVVGLVSGACFADFGSRENCTSASGPARAPGGRSTIKAFSSSSGAALALISSLTSSKFRDSLFKCQNFHSLQYGLRSASSI